MMVKKKITKVKGHWVYFRRNSKSRWYKSPIPYKTKAIAQKRVRLDQKIMVKTAQQKIIYGTRAIKKAYLKNIR